MVFGNKGPVFSGSWGNAADPGFGIASESVPDIANALGGCAVTVEHGAVRDACLAIGLRNEEINSESFKNEIANFEGSKRAVGQVLGSSGSDILLRLAPEMTGLGSLVRKGVLTGLSLTTVADETGVRPIELTLTTDPARGSEAKLSAEYKGMQRIPIKQLKMSAEQPATPMETTGAAAAEELTPLQTAVANLSETDRAAVMERLQKYQDEIDKLNSQNGELASAKEELSKVVQFKQADKEILEAQLAQLLERVKQATGFDRQAEVQKMLNHEDASVRGHGLSQMVMACSKAFDSFTVPAPPAAAAAVAEPAAKRAKVSDQSADVRNLLRAAF
jgi:hypothetical protein